MYILSIAKICPPIFFSKNISCIGGLSLTDTCEYDQQCTGTENANKCSRYRNQSKSSCRCNHGYIEKYSKCYRSKTSHYNNIILNRTDIQLMVRTT